MSTDEAAPVGRRIVEKATKGAAAAEGSGCWRVSERLLRTQLELSELAASTTLEGFIQASLDACERLTGSRIGFFHFVDADQEHLRLQTWSTNTYRHVCTAEGKGRHYPVSQAGVWVESLVTRRPVIHNDYASLPHRKGLPPGHAPVVRELTVPILRGGLVLGIMGVGNKPDDYAETDVEVLETLASLAIDIIERKRAEERLRESEERARQLLETSFDWIWETDAAGRYTFASGRVHELLGYDPAELVGRSPVEFLAEGEAPRLRAPVGDLLSPHEPFTALEHVNLHRDGRRVVLETSGLPVFAPDGRLAGYRGHARDVTERKRAELEIERRLLVESRLSKLTAHAPGVLWTGRTRPDGTMVLEYASEKFASYAGAAPSAFGHSVTQLVEQRLPQELDRLRAAVRTAAANMTEVTLEFSLAAPGERETWFEARALPEREADGDLVWHGFVHDVTARKRQERRLAMQETVSRLLGESNSLDEAGERVVEAITTAQPWDLGVLWDLDPRTGQPEPRLAWPPSARGADGCASVPGLPLARQVRDVGEPLHVADAGGLAMFGDHGRPEWRSGFGFPVVIRGETVVVATFCARRPQQPDPDLIRLGRQLGHQLGQFIDRTRVREQLRRFLTLSPVVLYVLRVEPTLLPLFWVSGNLEALTGFVAEEGAALGWWESRIHPDDRDRVIAAQSAIQTTGQLTQEFRFQRKDGTYIWLRDQKRLVRDADGGTQEIIGTWADITREVELETDLRQSQKMEAIGRLSGGIAHDFNNMLTVIGMQTEALLADGTLTGPLRTAVRDIASAAERSANLTRQLLLFSRRQPPTLVKLDLNATVEQTSKLLQRIVGEDVRVHVRCCRGPLTIEADHGMLDQVLLNLAVNARDAMPAGGSLAIETRLVTLDGPDDAARGRAGSFACLLVQDTGGGIAPDCLPRIFEPFFTTKEVGKGTGLGLATVFGIVEQHRGWIDVESDLGAGTTFRVFIPSSAPAGAEEAPRPPKAFPVARGRETILVVEDEPSLQRLLDHVLSPLGYVVLMASSGVEALEIWRAHRSRIALLLTDLVMPGGIGGVELAKRIRQDEPDLPVVCMSGYSPKLDEAKEGFTPPADFIAKPFTARLLAEVVRRTLDSAVAPGRYPGQ